MNALTLSSPAKVNLTLRVLGRRSDGYHEIETLFERIDWCDEIKISQESSGSGIRITCDHPAVPTEERNLALRAARAICEAASINVGLTVRIAKRIPVAGGLAGGSSNAATVLLGVNRLLGLGLSKKRLEVIGRQLGADVAFFLHEAPWAIGTERGDVIRPIESPYRVWQVVVVPPVAKPSTGAVYQALPHPLTPKDQDVKVDASFLRRLASGKLSIPSSCNDLEESRLVQREPMIQEAKRLLRAAGACWVTMSGSGPSVIGVVRSQAEAARMSQTIQTTTGWLTQVAQTI